MRAIDVHGFAGAFTLATKQAGFEIRAKREGPGGFGVPLVDANRHLIGDLEIQVSEPREWEAKDAELVFGNPPCSGFSMRSVLIHTAAGRVDWRGVDASANECMWDLVRFASRCEPAMVIFESVPGAGRKGRELMLQLRLELERLSGRSFDLFHVFHNAASVGGAAIRSRYFWVASSIPFGIEPPEVERVVTLRDRISDLEQVPLGSVEGHVCQESRRAIRMAKLAESGMWFEGERSGTAIRRAKEAGYDLGWENEPVSETGETQFAPMRLRYDYPSPVITGGALWEAFHPALPRFITHREAARIQGFPDDWIAQPAVEASNGARWWGKGVPVESGRWIATWARRALEGSPGAWKGEIVGDRERLLDVSDDWRRAFDPKAGTRTDSRSKRQIQLQAARFGEPALF